MNGANSPDGAKHPGAIVTHDTIANHTKTDRADAVPQTIAWVQVDGHWVAVTRIEVTGTPERRCITKFGADGAMLETTTTSPRPRPASTPSDTPTPTPTEK